MRKRRRKKRRKRKERNIGGKGGVGWQEGEREGEVEDSKRRRADRRR